MRGFDYDGVITKGMLPGTNDVIITGRCPEDVERTYSDMESRGIKFRTVYFMPPKFKQRGTIEGRENTGRWKALMIELLELSEFFEDDSVQFKTIVEECKNKQIKCEVKKV